jgi:hypothetical protein
MARQERSLARTDLESYFLIDESVVRRLVGSSAIMRQQISRLIELNQSSNVSIHVVPFKLGFYKGFRLPYVVFVFPDPEEEAILYLEDPHREAIIREDTTPEESESSDVAIKTPPTYLSIFSELWNQTSLEETSTILESALDQFNS